MKEKKEYVLHSKRRVEECWNEKKPYQTFLLGREFTILPKVFSPKYFNDTLLFAKNLPQLRGKSVLEIGSGSGVLSLFSIWKGAKNVMAIDINPEAVKNTKLNIERHGLYGRINSKKSNLFDSINSKFDVILWNYPFVHVSKKRLSLKERAVFDHNYNSLKKFASSAKNFLNKEGFFLVGFSSTMGDVKELRKIMNQNGFNQSLLFKEKPRKIYFELFKFTRRKF